MAGLGLRRPRLRPERRGGVLTKYEIASLRHSLADSRSPEVVAAHALALGLTSNEGAFDPLVELLGNTESPMVESACALGLGMMFREASRPPLAELLERSAHEPAVLEQSVIGLSLVAYRTTVPDLERVAAENGGLLAKTALLNAYGHSKDRRALTPLLEELGDEEALDIERAFAAVALGDLCERTRLPWTARISPFVNYQAGPDTLTGPTASASSTCADPRGNAGLCLRQGDDYRAVDLEAAEPGPIPCPASSRPGAPGTNVVANDSGAPACHPPARSWPPAAMTTHFAHAPEVDESGAV